MKVKELWIFLMVLICATAIPISAAPWTEYRITTSPASQISPDVSGNIIAWVDYRHSDTAIYAADTSDMNNPVEFVVSDRPYQETGPKVGGSFIFFQGIEGSYPSMFRIKNIWAYDLDTHACWKVTDYGSGDKNTPFIMGGNDGATVVWMKGNTWVKGYDIETDSFFEGPLAASFFVDVSGDIIIWIKDMESYQVYGFDMSIWQDFPITTNSVGLADPAIDGNIVVWVDQRNGNYDIYGADISDRSNPVEFIICTDANTQRDPAISGNIIVWEDNRNGNMDIYGYDISTQTEFQITDNTSDQQDPAISGHTVVWEDKRHGQSEIYATILYGPIVPRCTSHVQGDINGDCKVNFVDFALMLDDWLECNLDPQSACWE